MTGTRAGIGMGALFALAALVACRGSLAPRHPAGTRPVRVLMLSVDGAGADTLHDLWQRGELDGGGFARFFARGEVAAALLPVDPTVTSTNHVALVTGFGPGRTGIVGNKLHLPGAPWTQIASGFAAPIDSETLWEAARRQGKRVVALAWPGADASDARRRADRGMLFTNAPTGGVFPLRAYPDDFQRELDGKALRWPGAPDDAGLEAWLRGEPRGIDLDTWVDQAERFLHFFGAVWRTSVARDDWDLTLAYLPTIDEMGHRLLLTDARQWGDSPQRREACARARLRLWRAVDRELARLLDAVDLERTIVVVVSDHGMLPVHTALDPNALLRERGLLVRTAGGADAARTRAFAAADCAVAHVYVREGADREALIAQLATVFRDWRVGGEPVIERVVTRAELGSVGLDAADSGDLVLWTRAGFTFESGWGDLAAWPSRLWGMHGFLLEGNPQMRAIYLAVGPGVPHGEVPSLRNLEIAPRIARWLGIEPPRAQAAVP